MRRTKTGDEYGRAAPLPRGALESLEARLATVRAPYPSPDVRRILTAAEVMRGIEDRRSYQPKRRHLLYAKRESFLIVDFVRLSDDPEDAASFRRDCPLYFPAKFWEETLPSDEELFRGSVVLPAITDKPLPDDSPVQYQEWDRRPRMFWQGYRDLLRTAWALGFPDEYIPQLLNLPAQYDDSLLEDHVARKAPLLNISDMSYGQKDILVLLREPWRAKVCPWCHQPFIPHPKKPAQQFCPASFFTDPRESCSYQFRLEAKLSNWHKKKAKYRPPSKRKRVQKRPAA